MIICTLSFLKYFNLDNNYDNKCFHLIHLKIWLNKNLTMFQIYIN